MSRAINDWLMRQTFRPGTLVLASADGYSLTLNASATLGLNKVKA